MKKCLLGLLVVMLLGMVTVGSARAQSNMGRIYIWNLWQNQSGGSIVAYLQLENFTNPSWCALKYLHWCSLSAPAGSHHLWAVDNQRKIKIADTVGTVKAGQWFKWCVYGTNKVQDSRCQTWLKSNSPSP